jgi:membrane protein
MRWHALRLDSHVHARRLDAKRLLKHLWHELSDDHVAHGAAALAFYMALALFPGALFSLSVMPSLPIPHLQQAMTDLIHQTLPGASADVLMKGAQSATGRGRLLWFSSLFAMWSASSGVSGIIRQLNIVYEVQESRSFLRLRGLAAFLALAFFGLLVAAVSLAVFGGMLQSYMGDRLGWSQTLLTTFAVARWVVIVSALHFAFALVYYLAPNVKHPFTLFTPGSVAATVTLLLGSGALKLYVARFSTVNALYGGLGAVIVLLVWLFVAGWVILFGGELNDVVARERAR